LDTVTDFEHAEIAKNYPPLSENAFRHAAIAPLPPGGRSAPARMVAPPSLRTFRHCQTLHKHIGAPIRTRADDVTGVRGVIPARRKCSADEVANDPRWRGSAPACRCDDPRMSKRDNRMWWARSGASDCFSGQ
jgi:hypothetical protein